MVAEVIDPVTGAFQFGCIKRQIRSIEATNVRMMNLRLIIYLGIGDRASASQPRLFAGVRINRTTSASAFPSFEC